MATVTKAAGSAQTTNNAAITSASFTPAADDLLVAFAAATGQAGVGSVTDSQGLGWTRQASVLKNASADVLEVWTSNAPAAASAMTVTYTPGGAPSCSGSALAVYRVAGVTRYGSLADRSSGTQANQASGTPAIALGQAALTANPCLSAVFNGTNPAGLTAPTGWTATDTNVGYATPTTGFAATWRASGFTGATITWGSSSASAFCGVGIEVDTSAPPPVYPEAGWRANDARPPETIYVVPREGY